MTLQIAELLQGSETPAGDGITGALRCILILPDGTRRAAVLKRGPMEQVAAEGIKRVSIAIVFPILTTPYACQVA